MSGGWQNPWGMKHAELKQEVKTLAKRANQRLRTLEKKGYTNGLYKHYTGKMGRKRFKEGTANMGRAALASEYVQLRDFLTAKTSTLTGRKDSDYKRYMTAVKDGFTGTQEEFYELVDKYFTENEESYFSSKTTYKAITAGTVDILDKVAGEVKELEEKKRKGEALRRFLRYFKERQDG